MPMRLRRAKGAPLTHAELDGNFDDLDKRLDTVEKRGTATNAQLRDRGTHTGTQPASSIADFTAAVQGVVGSSVIASAAQAGASAGSTAGAQAAALAAQPYALAASSSAAAASQSATQATQQRQAAEAAAQAAGSHAATVPGALQIASRFVYQSAVPGFAWAMLDDNWRAVGFRRDGYAVVLGIEAHPTIWTGQFAAGFRFPIVEGAQGRTPLWIDLPTGKVGLDPHPDTLRSIEVALSHAPNSLRGIAQAMQVRRITTTLRAALIQERDGRTSEVVQPLSPPSTGSTTAIVHDSRPLDLIDGNGQSNFGGPDCDTDSPLLTAPYPHHAFCFLDGPKKQGSVATSAANLADLMPLRDGVQDNLPTLQALAAYAWEWHDRQENIRSPGRIWRADQYSGGAISLVGIGSQTYANLLLAAGALPATAAKYGRTGRMPILLWCQGESGPQDGTYETAFANWLDTAPGAVKAATGQAMTPLVGIIQIDEADYGAETHVTARLAHVAQARARAGQGVHILCPFYYAPRHAGSPNHTTMIGRAMYGETVADALRALCGPDAAWTGSWSPFWVTAASRTNAVIELTFSRPYGLPLQWDEGTDAWIKPTPNRGFVYADDSGTPPAILSVEIVGTDKVRITLAATPTGANRRIEIALRSEDPIVQDGWTAGRCELMVDTGRLSAFRAIGLPVPRTIRHYPVADRIAVP